MGHSARILALFSSLLPFTLSASAADESAFFQDKQLRLIVGSAAVAGGADLLVILSGVDGLMTKSDGTGDRIPKVSKIDDAIRGLAGGAGSERNVGGMVTKLQAAEIAAEGGIDTIIARGRKPNEIGRAHV
mgnify:CR=1 FL=1